jgi:hypothetical protein
MELKDIIPKLLHTGSHEKASYKVSCKIILDSENVLEDFKWNQSTSASAFPSKKEISSIQALKRGHDTYCLAKPFQILRESRFALNGSD